MAKRATTSTRNTKRGVNTRAIREFCAAHPGLTGRRVLHEMGLPDTKPNLQRVYQQRNYINKHGFKPHTDQPTTKSMVISDPPSVQDFETVFKICKEIGVTKVARITRALQKSGIK